MVLVVTFWYDIETEKMTMITQTLEGVVMVSEQGVSPTTFERQNPGQKRLQDTYFSLITTPS